MNKFQAFRQGHQKQSNILLLKICVFKLFFVSEFGIGYSINFRIKNIDGKSEQEGSRNCKKCKMLCKTSPVRNSTILQL